MTNLQQTQTLDLPDDIILCQILPRLPVKSLLKFKSVSKYWCSYISNPKFTKDHLKFSSSCVKYLLVHGPHFYSVSLDYHNKVDHTEIILKEPVRLNNQGDVFGPKPELKLIGSCNGLVCAYVNGGLGSTKDLFVLWNPATGEYRNIDVPTNNTPCFYGFVYVSALDDYKICATYFDKVAKTLDVFVFSWKTGNWKSVSNCLKDTILSRQLVGDFVDGTLFWAVNLGSPATKYGNYLIAFDIVNEEFETIPLMDCVDSYKLMHIQPKKSHGCMIWHCTKDDQIVDVWKLSRQGKSYYSWEKKFSVNPSKTSNGAYLGFIATRKSLREQLGQLKFVDVAAEDIEPSTAFNLRDRREVQLYVESLASPFGTTEDNSEGDKDQLGAS